MTRGDEAVGSFQGKQVSKGQDGSKEDGGGAAEGGKDGKSRVELQRGSKPSEDLFRAEDSESSHQNHTCLGTKKGRLGEWRV